MTIAQDKNSIRNTRINKYLWIKKLRNTSLTLLIFTFGCKSVSTVNDAPRILQAGAPGQASRSLDPEELSSIVQPKHHQADVEFMQGMIHHHNQALEMAALISERTASDELYDLGRRITISQEDEIDFMQRWLTDRGESSPEEVNQRPENMARMQMPGMLTESEMSFLRAAANEAFDRLFLEGMIKHHQGALSMVATLFNTSGAGLEPEIFQFAYHVDSDQYIEIERMNSMLEARR